MTTTTPVTAAPSPYVGHPWEARLGVVWHVTESLGALVALSLAWLVALALIVPLPAVTAAILRVALARARGRSPNLLPEFMAGLRESWRRATLLGGLSAVVTSVLAVDLWFLGAQSSGLAVLLRGGVTLLAAWWFLVSIHVWALVGGTGMPSARILRVAIGLTLVELPSTVAAAAAIVGVLLLLSVVPPALVLLGPGLVATVWGRLAWRAMGEHLAPDALEA